MKTVKKYTFPLTAIFAHRDNNRLTQKKGQMLNLTFHDPDPDKLRWMDVKCKIYLSQFI